MQVFTVRIKMKLETYKQYRNSARIYTQLEVDELVYDILIIASEEMWKVMCSKNSPPPHGTNAAKEAILGLLNFTVTQ
jgi:hypothetical protein